VNYKGEVLWGPPNRYHASCKIDLKYFPFDVQKCTLKFGSWMYDETQLNLSALANEVCLDLYMPNGEWHLNGVTVNR